MVYIKLIPNILTLFRIIMTLSLLFIRPLTTVFYILYACSGISDALDGFIARKTNSTSDIGAKLDSIADMGLYAVMLFKILPILVAEVYLPIWIWVGLVLAIRISAYIVSAIKYKKFASLHTYLNKATGFALFLAPYLLETSYFNIYCVVVCSIATLASSEELIIHIKSPKYITGKKTLIK